MESSRLFRLTARQGGDADSRLAKPSERRRVGSRRGDRSLSVAVVESIEELNRVFALRTAACLSGSLLPDVTDIDEGDLSATHLMACDGNDVVGALRVRTLDRTAILDRLVIKRSKYRSMIARQLTDTAIALCRAKGIQTIAGGSGMVGFVDTARSEAVSGIQGGWDDGGDRPTPEGIGGMRVP